MWTCEHCNGQTDDDFQTCWTCRIPRGGEADYHRSNQVLVTSTPSIETHEIVDYVGPVFGEVIYGANFFRDIAAGLTDFFGGRAESYENLIKSGRTAAISEMQSKAEKLGCNAIVAAVYHYEPIGNSMFLITASGTAVRTIPIDESRLIDKRGLS